MAVGPDRATVGPVAPLPPPSRANAPADPRAHGTAAGPRGAAAPPRSLEVDGLRLSIHGDGTAGITPLPGARVTVAVLARLLDELDARGVAHVTTSALGPADTGPWVAAGFTPATRLVLLRAEVRAAPPRARAVPRLRVGRRRDWTALAELDTRAFAPQGGLGEGGLLDAMAVTPAARVRVAGQPVVGFVIVGHDLRCGYLQRLAVAPEAEGRGIGSALVADTLRWLHRRGAREALVNTESGNARALALYERFGFVRQAEGLLVLERRR